MEDKTGSFHEIETYLQDWHCDGSTILKCYKSLTSDLIENGLIIEESRQITGKITKMQSYKTNITNSFYSRRERKYGT